jgi:hypothetical protein
MSSDVCENPVKKLKVVQFEEYSTHGTSPTTTKYLKTKTQSYFATSAIGLEFLLEEEIQTLLQPSAIKRVDGGGKVFFATDKNMELILKLRSAECLYAFVTELTDIPSDESGLDYLQKTSAQLDWEPALVCYFPLILVTLNISYTILISCNIRIYGGNPFNLEVQIQPFQWPHQLNLQEDRV